MICKELFFLDLFIQLYKIIYFVEIKLFFVIYRSMLNKFLDYRCLMKNFGVYCVFIYVYNIMQYYIFINMKEKKINM